MRHTVYVDQDIVLSDNYGDIVSYNTPSDASYLDESRFVRNYEDSLVWVSDGSFDNTSSSESNTVYTATPEPSAEANTQTEEVASDTSNQVVDIADFD